MTSNLIPNALYSVRSSTPFTVLYFAYLQNEREKTFFNMFDTYFPGSFSAALYKHNNLGLFIRNLLHYWIWSFVIEHKEINLYLCVNSSISRGKCDFWPSFTWNSGQGRVFCCSPSHPAVWRNIWEDSGALTDPGCSPTWSEYLWRPPVVVPGTEKDKPLFLHAKNRYLRSPTGDIW